MAVLLSGCGDRCEILCDDVASALARCKSDALTWADLGARSRRDFAASCKRDWDETSAGLSARDLELSLRVCEDTQEQVGTLTCDEIVALYGAD